MKSNRFLLPHDVGVGLPAGVPRGVHGVAGGVVVRHVRQPEQEVDELLHHGASAQLVVDARTEHVVPLDGQGRDAEALVREEAAGAEDGAALVVLVEVVQEG